MTREVDRRGPAGPPCMVVVALNDAPAARALATEGDWVGISWLAFRPATADHPASLHPLLGSGGELVPPPGGTCLPAAFSAAGHRQLEGLAGWWAGEPPAPVLDLPTGPSARRTLLCHLLGRALDALSDSARCQVALMAQLDEVRRANEERRFALECMENALHRLRRAPFHLVHHLLPGHGAYDLAAGPICQPLSGASAGLAALDLHVVARTNGLPEPRGYLLVGLRDPDSGLGLGAWTVPFDHVAGGWLRCALPTPLQGLVPAVEVVVAAAAAGGPAPRLALAPVGPDPELSARVAGRPLGQALALLTWAAAPDTPLPVPTLLWTPADPDARPGVLDYHLSPQDFARIEPTAPAPHPYFQLLCDEIGFRLNPVGPAPSTARLPAACLPGTVEVVITARVSGPGASHPVEYGLCLTEPGQPWAGDMDGADVLASSGWVAVPADGLPCAVGLALDSPLTRTADLHLASRMAGGLPPWNHWADCLEVRLRLRHELLAGDEAPATQGRTRLGYRRAS